jgi:aminopeptidase N
VIHLTESSQTVVFRGVSTRPVPSLLRGFSAPVRLEFPYTEADLTLLATRDSDAVNRWDAAQRSFVNAIRQLARAHRDGASLVIPTLLLRIASQLLDDRSSDPALLALALAMPDPAYVATLEPTVDPDGVTAASRYIEETLSRMLRDGFEDAYRRHRPRIAYAPTPDQIGARSLSNVCLRYLGIRDDDRAHALALAQYGAADNMTDAIAALAALRDSTALVRTDLFSRFEKKWRDEPLALDKWFALQARSLRTDTLETVRALIAHPRFNVRNPNRVRALVGAFTLGNFARFNALDGSGYAFAAEQVRALDVTNPQLASTIAGAFNLWKRYTEPRRTRMQRSLEKIARTRDLSPDVSEIVTRTLAS